MNSTLELRISGNAVAIFFLMNLLLIGTVSADNLKSTYPHEVHQSISLSDEKEWTPPQQMQRMRRAAPSEIWSAVQPSEGPSLISDSDKLEAHSNLAHEAAKNAVHSASSRRLLRDISPPGMWPPGDDDYDEGLSSMFHQRSLLAEAPGSRNSPTREFAERLMLRVQSLTRTSACLNIWRRDQVVHSDSDNLEARGKMTHAGAENVAHSASSRRLLRDISPPGMWPPGDDDYEGGSFSMSRRRFLMADAPDSRNSPTTEFADRLIPRIRSLLRTSARNIWRRDRSINSDSDNLEAYSNMVQAAENAPHLMSSRHLLRDISPPGMWPPGDDDYDEGLSSMSRQ
ncbi:hypothetical protein R1flu_026622 [Riccia fluitans]|uniref:Uncharacterized protein n=1 Tax=Riccia fluitans TaxID=41844 RepID=A0ABD1XGF6_9MARC